MNLRIAKKIRKEFLRWALVLGETGALWIGYFRPLRHDVGLVARAARRLSGEWQELDRASQRTIAATMHGRTRGDPHGTR